MLLMAMSMGANAADELYVCGKNVDLSQSYQVMDGVFYDASSKTLSISYLTAKGSGNDKRIITAGVEGLTIEFLGNNKFTTSGAACIRINARTTITRNKSRSYDTPCTLSLTSDESAIIIRNGSVLTIDDMIITAHGDDYSINGDGSSSGSMMKVNHSYITLDNSSKGNCIRELGHLVMTGRSEVRMLANGSKNTVYKLKNLVMTDGISIFQPTSVQFDSSKMTICYGDTEVKSNIVLTQAIAVNSTNFPDPNFLSYLKSQSLAKDGYFITSEDFGIQTLDVSDRNIKSMKGLEHFTRLSELYVQNNQIETLTLPEMQILLVLYCHSNKLKTLNVPNSYRMIYDLCCCLNPLESLVLTDTKVKELNCSYTNLKSLNLNASVNTLESLNCNDCSLTSLDLSNYNKLKTLTCQDNGLTTLKLPTDGVLDYLNVEGNKSVTLDLTNSTKLATLYCGRCGLTSLNVTKNTNLKALDISNSEMTSIDLSKCTLLENFYCVDGKLSSLNTSKNTKLKKLRCTDTWNLGTLNLANNTELTELYVNSSKLTSLDVSNNTELTELCVNSKKLTSLDVSKNTKLTKLDCSYSYLSALTVTNNKELKELYCNNNEIKDQQMDALVSSLHNNGGKLYVFNEMDMNDGNIFTTANASAAKAKGWTPLKLDNGSWVPFSGEDPDEDLGIAIDSHNFVDKAFREYILANIDKDKNGYLDEYEAWYVTELNIPNMGIEFLNGIGYFKYLYKLNCKGNKLTKLDLSWNTYLETLDCSDNQLTRLPLNKNTELTYLTCDNNQIMELDLSNCRGIEEVSCKNNSISYLTFGDKWNYSILNSLDCSNNQLLSIVFKMPCDIEFLNCEHNEIVALDLSKCPDLTTLKCSYNEITSIELQCRSISTVHCAMNKMDVTNMGKLVASLPETERGTLWAVQPISGEENKITDEQIAEATKKGWRVRYQTPDGEWANYTNSGVAINEKNFPDDQFRNFIAENFDKDKNNYLSEEEIKGAPIIDIREKIVFDANSQCLKGIEFLTEMVWLYCDNCEVNSLDVSKNPKLYILSVNGNKFQNGLNVSNPELEFFYCTNCGLEKLDLSNNPKLRFLYCNDNQFEELDLSNNPELMELNCSFNQLKELDLSNNPELSDIYCNDNQLYNLDFTNNIKLDGAEIQHNHIRGQAMTDLVNSLPPLKEKSIWYAIRTCSKESEDGNQITKAQAAIAEAKNWTVFSDVYTEEEIPGDVNGDSTTDVADIASVISVMSGTADITMEALADVNSDGVVDVADIATIITIMAENARRLKEIAQ